MSSLPRHWRKKSQGTKTVFPMRWKGFFSERRTKFLRPKVHNGKRVPCLQRRRKTSGPKLQPVQRQQTDNKSGSNINSHSQGPSQRKHLYAAKLRRGGPAWSSIWFLGDGCRGADEGVVAVGQQLGLHDGNLTGVVTFWFQARFPAFGRLGGDSEQRGRLDHQRDKAHGARTRHHQQAGLRRKFNRQVQSDHPHLHRLTARLVGRLFQRIPHLIHPVAIIYSYPLSWTSVARHYYNNGQ